MMKKLHLIIMLFLVVTIAAQGQNSVGIGTTVPNTKAVLHLQPVGAQGFIMPKLSIGDTANFGALGAADKGLTYYDTTSNCIRIYTGSHWIKLADSSFVASSSSTMNAGNGLTLNGNIFELGGNLTKNTTISSSATHSMTFTGSPLIIEDAVKASRLVDFDASAYFVDPDENYSAHLYGNISIGSGRGDDDDFLYFDQGVHSLGWSETNTRFEFNNALYVAGNLDVSAGISANNNITTSSSVIAETHLYVGNDIFHYLDGNTKLLFDDDRIQIMAGGIDMIDMEEGANNRVSIGWFEDVDVRLANFQFLMDGATGDLYIGHGSTTDNDYLYFDNGGASFSWNNALNALEMSHHTVVPTLESKTYISVGTASETDNDYIYFDSTINTLGGIMHKRLLILVQALQRHVLKNLDRQATTLTLVT